MKFIITEDQLQKIANLLSNVPMHQGLPVIDILRSLPMMPEKPITEEFHPVTTDNIKGK